MGGGRFSPDWKLGLLFSLHRTWKQNNIRVMKNTHGKCFIISSSSPTEIWHHSVVRKNFSLPFFLFQNMVVQAQHSVISCQIISEELVLIFWAPSLPFHLSPKKYHAVLTEPCTVLGRPCCTPCGTLLNPCPTVIQGKFPYVWQQLKNLSVKWVKPEIPHITDHALANVFKSCLTNHYINTAGFMLFN